MKITITVSETKEIEIPVPSFYIDEAGANCVGILDEDTVVRGGKSDSLTYIQNGKFWIMKTDLQRVVTEPGFSPCSEEKFFDVYNAMVQSISLNPVLTP
jgi:hypothetical protein